MDLKDTFIMKCWFCHSEMKWLGDYDYEDYDLDGDGIVAILSCNKCDAMAEFWTKIKDSQKIKNNRFKTSLFKKRTK